MELIDKLRTQRHLRDDEYAYLLESLTKEEQLYLFQQAQAVALENFGNKIFIRGLIEFSNICKNNCYYCGIRRDNHQVERYRLSKEDVLACCQAGYALGFRTFVLQSGEEDGYRPEVMCDIIQSIRQAYPTCAITLSLGEKTMETYSQYYAAGANRYLLRHETINAQHYASLHPQGMQIENRVQCLHALKAVGFQTGSGIMVGSPKQTTQHLIEDINFLEALQPEMIGVGPYLPHEATPFAKAEKGSLQTTLIFLAIMRLMHPKALLPSTTALATIAADGREQGILAGANVVMPNLSPVGMRKKYQLYNDKACMGDEAAQSLQALNKRLQAIGYEISYERGDFKENENV